MSVFFEVKPVAPEKKTERVVALEQARDEIRKACAVWEKDGTDERSCEEVALDTINAMIVRGPN